MNTGIVKISKFLFHDLREQELESIFSKIYPYESYTSESGVYVMTCKSKYFRKLKENEPIPEYLITMERKSYKKPSTVISITEIL